MHTTWQMLERLIASTTLALLFLIAQMAQPGYGSASPSEPAGASAGPAGMSAAASGPDVAHSSLTGRHRLEFRVGYWDSGRQPKLPLYTYSEDKTRVEDLVGAFSYSYWSYDQLAADITFRGLVAEAISIESVSGGTESAVVIASAMFGVRFYPMPSARMPLRPYLAAGIGPYLGVESLEEIDQHGDRTVNTTKTLGSFGGFLGGGLDIQMGRHLMLGIGVGYNLMADFQETLGFDDNYSGFEVSTGLSFLFG